MIPEQTAVMTSVASEGNALDDRFMAASARQLDDEPHINHLITEDDTPVDNLFSEKQQRLLTEPLYSTWRGGEQQRSFLAAANVGLFASADMPPLMPDVFLSMDVHIADEWFERRHRTYFFWEFGKSPEVVIEIVSNRMGGEATRKLEQYARIGVDHYVIFDPAQQLSDHVLRVFERRWQRYTPVSQGWFPGIGLGLTLWEGIFENKQNVWLRWCDENGAPIASGAERAAAAEAEIMKLRAELDRLRNPS